jgi:hypothetical protein
MSPAQAKCAPSHLGLSASGTGISTALNIRSNDAENHDQHISDPVIIFSRLLVIAISQG